MVLSTQAQARAVRVDAPPADEGGAGRALRAVWVAGVLLTATVWLADASSSAVYAPRVHLVADTVDGMVAAVVSGLLVVRARRTRRQGDRLMAEAFGLLALASLVLSVGGALVEPSATAVTWAEAVTRNAAVVVLLLGALTLDRWGRGRWIPWSSIVVVALTALTLAATWSGSGPVRVVSIDQERLRVDTDPLLAAAVVLGAGLALVTAILLGWRQRRGRLLLGGWLVPAVVLLAIARVHYVLFPSIYSSHVFTGDLLRTAGYAALLLGAVREVVDHWSSESRAAVAEERRRLARELHDGAVQEMTLARLDALALANRHDDPALGEVVASLDLALVEVRAAMEDLVSAGDPIQVVIARTAHSVGRRLGVEVDVRCALVPGGAAARHDLVRIVREAMSNAVRHGGAARIQVEMRRAGQDQELVVRDDGDGFDPAVPVTGFGLVSMAERARRLGGELRIDSEPGRGTTVTVRW